MPKQGDLGKADVEWQKHIEAHQCPGEDPAKQRRFTEWSAHRWVTTADTRRMKGNPPSVTGRIS
jgi:hypothetical protein